MQDFLGLSSKKSFQDTQRPYKIKEPEYGPTRKPVPLTLVVVVPIDCCPVYISSVGWKFRNFKRRFNNFLEQQSIKIYCMCTLKCVRGHHR